MIWKCGDVDVHYASTLNGYGTTLAGPFLDYVRRVGRPHYRRCFEWCAGPGFIGITMWRARLTDELVLADKNPAVRPWVEQTRQTNNLPLTYYESDNFNSLPPSERFDLVVANPPNYFRLNPEHPSYAALRDDPRPNDPQWKIHRAFYATVKGYLNPGAELFISEVELDQCNVFMPQESTTVAYDLREEAPREAFSRMIEAGGLELMSVEPYFTGRGVTFHMMRARFPG